MERPAAGARPGPRAGDYEVVVKTDRRATW
jgi:hypothetical protein